MVDNKKKDNLTLGRPPSPTVDFDKIKRILEWSTTNANRAPSNLVTNRILEDNSVRAQIRQLETEITGLKSEINNKSQALTEQKLDAKAKESQIDDLKTNLTALEEKQNLSHLLTRVGTAAQQKLLGSPDFRNLFSEEIPRNAFVVSIDIRRSTELMLKAREPKLYAQFILALATQLREIIIENYGIFDKFTGDGILAFFPDFFSGDDAGYFAMKAAADCHKIFAEHYEENKRCFLSILRDIGLGIGMDYGQVQIVQIGGDLTVVGTPVVYACRMGGAEAGHTYINQPAFEQLFEKYSAFCDFEEREINFKHEGNTLAYSIELNGKEYTARIPQWCGDGGEKVIEKSEANDTDRAAAPIEESQA